MSEKQFYFESNAHLSGGTPSALRLGYAEIER